MNIPDSVESSRDEALLQNIKPTSESKVQQINLIQSSNPKDLHTFHSGVNSNIFTSKYSNLAFLKWRGGKQPKSKENILTILPRNESNLLRITAHPNTGLALSENENERYNCSDGESTTAANP